MRDQVGPDPGCRGAGAAQLLADIDEQAEIALRTAIAERLVDAPEAGLLQVLDRVGMKLPQTLGLVGPRRDRLDQPGRPADQLFAAGRLRPQGPFGHGLSP